MRESREILDAGLGPVEVRLDESPTTGYRWELTAAPDAVELKHHEFTQPAGPPEAGGGGTHLYAFHVHEPGEHVLRFELRRAWDPEKPLEARTVHLRAEP